MKRSRAGISLVAFLWVAFALNYVDRQMIYSMFPALRADLGFAEDRLGLIGSVFLWVYLLGMPIAGRLADTGRREWMVLASVVLWSAATFGCGSATSQGSMLGWRAAMGITESLYFPAALALIASHYPAQSRSRALGIHQSAQFVGVVIGGWYGGWSADHIGWRTAFAWAGAFGLVYSAVLWLVFRKLEQPAAEDVTAKPGRVGELLQSWCFITLCLAFAAYCAMQWIFFAWLPSFLYDRYHLSMTDSGWNATVFVQGSTIIGILFGRCPGRPPISPLEGQPLLCRGSWRVMLRAICVFDVSGRFDRSGSLVLGRVWILRRQSCDQCVRRGLRCRSLKESRNGWRRAEYGRRTIVFRNDLYGRHLEEHDRLSCNDDVDDDRGCRLRGFTDGSCLEAIRS